jgi:predicted nucleic acid-binding protein
VICKSVTKKSDISQITDRRIFFDANVLLYLFWPVQSYWLNIYSSIYSDILAHNMQSHVNFTVISEVVNRATRIEYEYFLRRNGLDRSSLSFKQYRNCKEGQQTIFDIYRIIEADIICKFTITGRAFTDNDISNMLSTSDMDINDKAIEHICLENNFILLTNDSDFRNSCIDILSGNSNLIQ